MAKKQVELKSSQSGSIVKKSVGFATVTQGFGSMEPQHTILCCGVNGSGKTMFTGSWPGLVYLNYDQGVRTLQAFYGDKKDVLVFDYSYGVDVYKGMLDFVQMLEGREGPFKKFEPKTIAVDSVTALCMHMQDELIRDGYKGAAEKDKGALSLPDYSRSIHRMLAFVNQLKQTGLNVILTATLQWKENPVTHELTYYPNMLGNAMAPAIMDTVDHIILFKGDPKEKKYMARLVSTVNFEFARYRGKAKADIIESITYDKFIKNLG